jgi:competence protein ComEC
MKYLKDNLIKFLIIAFIIGGLGITYLSYTSINDQYLKVIFIDIGQGDSIYIEAPNGRQMLIDGGSGREILAKLVKIMPPLDKSIDVVVVSNPDLDHIGGLVEVLKNYDVEMIIESGTKADSIVHQRLQDEILKNKIKKVIARRNQKIILDKNKNIYFHILFPDRDVSSWEKNEGSLVGKLIYNDISFMLMGDATKFTENVIMWNEKQQDLKSNVIKLGHHGSKTSSSLLWLELINPDLAIISAGRNNKYGHPHKEVLDNLNELKIKHLFTKDGNIFLKTNGQTLFNQENLLK